MNPTELSKLVEVLEKLNQTLSNVRATDPVAQIILSLVPLLGTILGLTLFFFFFLWQYKTKKELIRSGQYQSRERNYRELALLGGFICIGAGLPLTILFLAIEGVTYASLGGIIPLTIGVMLIIYYVLTRR